MSAQRIADRNGKKIAALLREVVKVCRDEGLKNPKLFFEPESATIFVMDGDHSHWIDEDRAGMGARQEAIVARIPMTSPGCAFDAGAW